MYLDAQEIFGLSGDGEGGAERHLAFHTTHRAMTDEGVATPRAVICPCDAIGIFHGFHQLWNAVIVVGLRFLALLGFINGLPGLGDGVVDVVQLGLQLCNLGLVGIVLGAVVIIFLLRGC